MSPARTLRVATFNIKHGATASGYLGRPGRLAEACAAIDADILALQEVDRRVWRSGFADLLERARGSAYADAVFGRAMGANLVSLINPGGRYGVGLLVRGQVVDHETLPLHGDYVRLPFGRRRNVAPEPRVALLARVRLASGIEVSVATTHIGGPRRPDFTRAVAARLMQLPGPHVLVGDHNATLGQVRDWLEESPLRLVPRPPELADGYRQSDHIAIDGLEVTSVSAQWTAVSDHPVLLAELEVTAGVTSERGS